MLSPFIAMSSWYWNNPVLAGDMASKHMCLFSLQHLKYQSLDLHILSETFSLRGLS